MNYAQIKSLDEESLQRLTEGSGPSDKCICSLLAPAEDTKKGIRASIKRAFTSIKQGRKRRSMGQKSIEIPLSFTKGGKGIYTTKEVVERKSACGKCGCDSERVVLKHSFANIRITSPDVSSLCPCPTDCLPDKNKLSDNIQVTIERVTVYDVEPGSGFVDPGSSLVHPGSSLVDLRADRFDPETALETDSLESKIMIAELMADSGSSDWSSNQE